jgi:hypothetical protein
MPVIRPPSDDAVNAKMEPYVTALGKVAHAWNKLQESLGQLFCTITGLENAIGQAIWHSTANDRAQREMLRAAILALDDAQLSKRCPKAKNELIKMLNDVDSLSDKRNTAIHAPMSVAVGDGDIELMPVFFYGNPRAKKLHGKDILTEFEWYEQSADTITVFARAARTAIIAGAQWPGKHSMPILQQKKSKSRRRESGAE